MLLGYRSGLEVRLAKYLTELKQSYLYEKIKIEWEDLTYRTYTPDFVLSNGIIIESKGLFTAVDRRKHIEIHKQHPTLDVRFVFYNSKTKITKTSKTTYAMWCDKNDSNKWDGTMSLSVISSQDNDLDKKDNDALQYLATLLCSTVPFMEDDEDFRDALVEYADDLNEKEIEDTLALKYDGNIVHVDFKNKH